MGVLLISVTMRDGKHPTLPIDGSEKLMEFLADGEADVADLPTTGEYTEGGQNYGKAAKGSKALVLDNGGEYYLDTAGAWTKFGLPEAEEPPVEEPVG